MWIGLAPDPHQHAWLLEYLTMLEEWTRSSRCESSHCLTARWQRSSRRESAQRGEVTTRGSVLVRDSKDPDGGMLAFGPEAWSRFLGAVKGGQFV